MGEPVTEASEMLDTLVARGFVRSDEVRAALEAVGREPFSPAVCHPLATVDAPLPLMDGEGSTAAVSPSFRIAAILLEALELEPGQRVLVRGEGVAWLGALAAHVVDHGLVRVEETDDALRRSAMALGPQLVDEVPALYVAPGPEDRPVAWDRILLRPGAVAPGDPTDPAGSGRLDGPAPGVEQLLAALGELGLLVEVDPGPRNPGLRRLVRAGDETAEMHLGGALAGSAPPGNAPSGTEDGVSVSQALRLEALLADAWARQGQDRTAQGLREAVDETIGRALSVRGLVDAEPTLSWVARAAFQIGYVHQMAGEAQAAHAAYTASARALPTAEAYTFRGWARSFEGDVRGAIEDCKHAIEVDEALGNPYNDIGAYLLELDEPRRAIGWLEQATEAERYSSPVFPYLNLGRAYVMLGETAAARDALEQALRIEPGYGPAQALLERLERDP